MKRPSKKLRVAIVAGDSHEVIALGRLVTIAEIMEFGSGELKVVFLPDDSEPIRQAVEKAGYEIIVEGKVRYRGVRRSFAQGYVKSYNRLNSRGQAKVVRSV